MATIDVDDAHGAVQAVQLPLAPGRAADAASRPVALSTENVAILGATNETAPASDTASSGLNGRLQRIAQRLTSLIAATLSVLTQSSQRATYQVTINAYAAYATPTDMFSITGSGTKKIQIIALTIFAQSTTVTLQTIDFVKRSAANTGGTPTVATAIPLDSTDAAATAVVTTYGSAPSLGAAVGTVNTPLFSTGLLTAAPGSGSVYNMANAILEPTTITLEKPITLNSAAECLCINYKGAALTSGFLAQFKVVWVEV